MRKRVAKRSLAEATTPFFVFGNLAPPTPTVQGKAPKEEPPIEEEGDAPPRAAASGGGGGRLPAKRSFPSEIPSSSTVNDDRADSKANAAAESLHGRAKAASDEATGEDVPSEISVPEECITLFACDDPPSPSTFEWGTCEVQRILTRLFANNAIPSLRKFVAGANTVARSLACEGLPVDSWLEYARSIECKIRKLETDHNTLSGNELGRLIQLVFVERQKLEAEARLKEARDQYDEIRQHRSSIALEYEKAKGQADELYEGLHALIIKLNQLKFDHDKVEAGVNEAKAAVCPHAKELDRIKAEQGVQKALAGADHAMSELRRNIVATEGSIRVEGKNVPNFWGI